MVQILQMMQILFSKSQVRRARQVQVALSQAALASQQISSFQVRLANRNQVVAPNFFFLLATKLYFE
jgi:hypothetical protein